MKVSRCTWMTIRDYILTLMLLLALNSLIVCNPQIILRMLFVYLKSLLSVERNSGKL